MNNEYTTELKKSICNILEDCIKKVESNDDYLMVADIISEMVYKLKDDIPFSGINGETILLRDTVNNIIKYNNEFLNYKIDDDRMEWIKRKFHDSCFDYDEFEKGVIDAMRYVENNYEE